MTFSSSFFAVLVIGAIALALVGGLGLLVLLVRDMLKESIW